MLRYRPTGTPLDHTTIPAFCINLDHRTDRWATVQEQFSALSWPVARRSGVIYAAPEVYGIDGRHAGALDSHRAVWREVVERNIPVAAVFEDDVVFTTDFGELFAAATAQLPRDWRLWWMHSTHARTRRIAPLINVLLSAGWGAHAYLITTAGANDLLSIPDNDHIDVLITRGYLRHGGTPYGMPLKHAIAFQRGDDDSNIPATQLPDMWREQREKYWR